MLRSLEELNFPATKHLFWCEWGCSNITFNYLASKWMLSMHDVLVLLQNYKFYFCIVNTKLYSSIQSLFQHSFFSTVVIIAIITEWTRYQYLALKITEHSVCERACRAGTVFTKLHREIWLFSEHAMQGVSRQ